MVTFMTHVGQDQQDLIGLAEGEGAVPMEHQVGEAGERPSL